MVWPAVVSLLLGSSGFFLAGFLYHKKNRKEPLVCPMRARCDLVIHSSYSRFLGVRVELLGMFYYGATTLAEAALISFPALNSTENAVAFFVIKTFAFLFSVYLISIQFLVIRNWCSWCMVSATLCALLFGLGVYGLTGI